jgi:hypothetical protein
VIHGVGRAAPSAEVMRRVTAASVRANPAAAGLIARHAGDSYRGPDRGELNRRPEEHPRRTAGRKTWASSTLMSAARGEQRPCAQASAASGEPTSAGAAAQQGRCRQNRRSRHQSTA